MSWKKFVNRGQNRDNAMKILNLEDYIHLFGERDTHRSLSSFCCHEDDDVQAYIRERAFDDELAHRARTKLFIDERHQ